MLMDLDLVSGEAAQLIPTAVQERMGQTVRLVSLDSMYIQKNTKKTRKSLFSRIRSKFQSPADTLKASMKFLFLQTPQSSIPHH